MRGMPLLRVRLCRSERYVCSFIGRGDYNHLLSWIYFFVVDMGHTKHGFGGWDVKYAFLYGARRFGCAMTFMSTSPPVGRSPWNMVSWVGMNPFFAFGAEFWVPGAWAVGSASSFGGLAHSLAMLAPSGRNPRVLLYGRYLRILWHYLGRNGIRRAEVCGPDAIRRDEYVYVHSSMKRFPQN